ncbi:MAG: hypothetical protein HXY52_06885 [Nitrospirae bacterium]|jgi:hypothetical protein|nr:hypothetical protein [Nitrospirota bacterium]
MNKKANEKGFVKVALVLIILVICAYVGYKVGMPYYKYSAFKADAKEITRIGLGEVERTKNMLLERAHELKIPIEEDAISVIRKEKTVQVNTSWKETVDFMGLYQKEFVFNIDIEE